MLSATIAGGLGGAAFALFIAFAFGLFARRDLPQELRWRSISWTLVVGLVIGGMVGFAAFWQFGE